MSMQYDFAIIGAGIAGASIAYFLAPYAHVLLIERESQPGYHSTGRSAAAFIETYGTPQVRALTRVTRSFLFSPPAGFSDAALVHPRPTILIAGPGQDEALNQTFNELHANSPLVRRLDAAETLALLPCLRPELVLGSVLDPGSADIDVNAVHQGFLRGAARGGAQLVCNADLRSGVRGADSAWRIETTQGTFRARVLIDAAGAWADVVAHACGVTALGVIPKRRSAFVFDAPANARIEHWPLAASIDEGWYIKPDAGLLLGSPANADPTTPQDVQPEEFDIALGIDRITTVTTLEIRRPRRTWAGLRTFSPDGDLVAGFDVRAPGFFWLAGQGGYGIQTSAAMGESAACLARGMPLPAPVSAEGITEAMLSPQRLESSASG